MKNTRATRLIALLALMSVPSLASAQWNLSNDWSSSFNPNGVWTFGTRSAGNLASTGLSVYTTNGTLSGWFNFWGAGLPTIAKNVSSTTQSATSVIMGAGEVSLHPGSGGEYSIVRFTAPGTGLFSIAAHFYGADCCATTTDANVLVDGIAMFSGYVSGFGAAQDYAANVNLNAGDVVDFAVGFGSNGSYFNDTTGLDLSIDAVTASPEPASIALVATGLLGLAGIARRRRPHGSMSS